MAAPILARQKPFLASPRPPPGADMKSWKKERYRRQKLFLSIKMRRRVSRDLINLSRAIMNDWRKQIKYITRTCDEHKPDKHTTD